jgi:hypothetical protein
LAFGAVGAVVVLLGMGLAWALSPADDSTEVVASTPDTTEASVEEDPPDPELEGSPGSGSDDLETVVAEITAWVEEERGLAFEEDPSVELADEGEFQERLLADFDDDADELQESEDELRALGLIDADVDFEAELRELVGVAVLGFYDPETDELVVRAGDITPLARITIAHELVHALDDQHFDLDRPEYDDDASEVGTGFGALTEGNASVIDQRFTALLTDDERAAADAEEAQLAASIDPQIPLILRQLLRLPYELGPVLVDALVEEGGQEALDAAFEEPPTTSEQLLDPQRYLDGEEAIEVPAPEPDGDGEILYEGSFGAISLGFVLGEPLAGEVIEGWGGDAYVLWRDGDQVCARATFVGDTDEDTEQIAGALRSWAAGHPDAQVTPTEGGFVTFTACG